MAIESLTALLQRLAGGVHRGELDGQAAEALATGSPELDSGDPPELAALSNEARSLAPTSDWRQALVLERLVLAVCEARSGRYAPVTNTVRLDWIDVVKRALMKAPDGALLRSAREAGERALTDAQASGDAGLRAEAIHRLGLMYLDAYTARFSTLNYAQRFELWQQGADVEWSQTGVRPEPMPPPADGLAESETFLREAAELRDGVQLALALKALCQCLVFENVLRRDALGDGNPAGDKALKAEMSKTEREIDSVADRALAMFKQFDDPVARIALLGLLQGRGREALEEVKHLVAPSGQQLEERYGIGRAVELVRQGMSVLGRFDPQEALALIERMRELLRRDGEATYSDVLIDEGVFLCSSDDIKLPEQRDNAALAAEVDRLLSAHASGALDGAAAFAGLMHLAYVAIAWGAEQVGLDCLEHAKQMSPALACAHPEALGHAGEVLHSNLADGLYAQEDWAGSVTNYVLAMGEAMDLGLLGTGLVRLGQIADIFNRKPVGADTVLAAVLAFFPRMADIDLVLGSGSVEPLQAIYKRATLALVQAGDFSLILMSLLWQNAKGLRLSSLMYADPPPRLDSGQLFGEDLTAIDALRTELTDASELADVEPPGVDDELLLSAYTRPRATVAGHGAKDRLANLEHRVDEQIEQVLLDRAGSSRIHVSLEKLQPLLPERMVLVDTFAGASSTGTVAIYHLIATREEVTPARSVLSLVDRTGILQAAGRTVNVTELGLMVATVRQALLDGAYDEQVSQSTLGVLSDHEEALFGKQGLETLERLRGQGKTHLCLVPHGPLRYYPWHLLGAVENPLGARWVITYLPSLAGVADPRLRGGAQRSGLAAFGLEFEGDPRGYERLRRAPLEAKRVARAMGGTAILDGKATKPAVIEGLRTARWVHLATHGLHDAGAPAFQRIILAGRDGSDGELAAHELLGLDLRGLEVVTLSACETALGRFDPSDNIRGLPANLLIAGASVIVGTLWPVRDSASGEFFERLYRELGKSQDPIEAFGVAQTHVREAFPNYADWGTFYYLGHVISPPKPPSP